MGSGGGSGGKGVGGAVTPPISLHPGEHNSVHALSFTYGEPALHLSLHNSSVAMV